MYKLNNLTYFLRGKPRYEISATLCCQIRYFMYSTRCASHQWKVLITLAFPHYGISSQYLPYTRAKTSKTPVMKPIKFVNCYYLATRWLVIIYIYNHAFKVVHNDIFLYHDMHRQSKILLWAVFTFIH